MNRIPARLSLVLLLTLALAAMPALAATCVVPDNGTGTIDLPPAGCGYVSPDDLHVMIDGLPSGSTIRIDPMHDKFLNPVRSPGGSLSGETEEFDSSLTMQMTGTGALGGFSRTITVPLHCRVDTAPRNPGDPLQQFSTDMVQLQGEIFGDPDFDLLRVTGGTASGLPSPGQTTLTRLPGGDFNVDSFFDIEYRIEFVGAPGGSLSGMSGSTEAGVHMSTGEAAPAPPCVVAPDADGSVSLPPAGCSYVSPSDLHVMIDGLPAGTEIHVAPEHSRFFPVTTEPGGTLDGEVEHFGSQVLLHMTGTGDLAGFQRDVAVPLQTETHIGPRNPGDPVQDFPTDMYRLQGEISGDPDFDLLRIQGGTSFGLPSPGHTTLTRLPSGNWNVDSFFDIEYRIEFQGASSSVLAGFGGVTTDSVRMQASLPTGQVCPPIPGSTDVFPATATMVVQIPDLGQEPFVVRLSSADLQDTEAQRGDQEGDVISTEILSMDLRGSHPLLGPVEVRGGSAQGLAPSPGQLTSVRQDPETCGLLAADSFFDVFVEIDVPSLGETWAPDRPLRLEGEVSGIPPRGTLLQSPSLDPVDLIDNATGGLRGQILYAGFQADPPLPPAGSDCFDTRWNADVDLGDGQGTRAVDASGASTVQRASPSSQCEDGSGPCSTDADCPLGILCLPSRAQDHELVEMEVRELDVSVPDPVSVVLRPGPPSAGQNVSQPPRTCSSTGDACSSDSDCPSGELCRNNTYRVDSFFDIFVDVSSAQHPDPLHNDLPIHVEAQTGGLPGIPNVPPNPITAFESLPSTCSDSGATCGPGIRCPLPGEICGVPLVDANGVTVGSIGGVQHTVDVRRDCQPPPDAADYCLDASVDVALTLFSPFCESTDTFPGTFRVLLAGPGSEPFPGPTWSLPALMAAASFEGVSDCVGPVSMRLGSQASGGQTNALTSGELFPADSFFDVSLAMDTGIGPLTAGPLPMSSLITELPPVDGARYAGPGTAVPLVSSDGTAIGELRVSRARLDRQGQCSPDSLLRLRFQSAGATGGPVPEAASDTITLDIPAGGGGLVFDVARGSFSAGQPFGAAGSGLASAACIQDDGPGTITDPTLPLLPGDGLFYVAREVFVPPAPAVPFIGTWNGDGAGQIVDRDAIIVACP